MLAASKPLAWPCFSRSRSLPLSRFEFLGRSLTHTKTSKHNTLSFAPEDLSCPAIEGALLESCPDSHVQASPLRLAMVSCESRQARLASRTSPARGLEEQKWARRRRAGFPTQLSKEDWYIGQQIRLRHAVPAFVLHGETACTFCLPNSVSFLSSYK